MHTIGRVNQGTTIISFSFLEETQIKLLADRSSDSSRSISVHGLDELQGEFCKRAKPREAVQNDDQTKKEEAKVLFFGVDDEDI